RIASLASSVQSPSTGRVQGNSNRINGALWLVFLIGGFIAAVWSFLAARKDFLPKASSEHGLVTDELFWVTMIVITIVFVMTHILLFYFPFRYQYKEGQKARFFPDNNKLEIAWTIVPAIVLTLLVFSGWKAWRDITSEAPQDAVVVEVVGKQFNWIFRYPGKDDNQLGQYNYKLIDATNEIGLDVTDEATFDDFTTSEIHIPKGKPILFKIHARDVLHSCSAPHFRLKMDAVPGMPTKFWFTPTKTTDEMRNELGKPNFNYELVCQEVCGKAHFSMRAIIVVEDEDVYNKWYSEQPTWLATNPENLEKIPANLKEKAIKASGITPEQAAAWLKESSSDVPQSGSASPVGTSALAN
ncbi:MAG: cytochrome c oxidase subunit II, partial [Ferruginibacter sp.]|nr:cytochrome c oxidase subunit II [Cytophagales bacterium]